MDFLELAKLRQSCRAYDETREVEPEKLQAILEAGRLAPSACNSQPYRITVCQGGKAKEAATAVSGMGMNSFAAQAPVLLLLSEENYNKSAALGAKLKKNDYRSLDIGILTAYLTSEAASLGLATCILGWLDSEKLQALANLEHPVRLVIALGYAKEGDSLREKKRKALKELVQYV